MILFEGKKFKVVFVDHTKERINKMWGMKNNPDVAKKLLGNNQGTVCFLYMEAETEGDPSVKVWQLVSEGVGKVYSGSKALNKPPDTFKKKTGHAESLGKALRNLGFGRVDVLEFMKEWHK